MIEPRQGPFLMTTFSRTCILLISLCISSHLAFAQCPDGRPSCPPPPPPPPTCGVTVNIKGPGNRPLGNVEVRIGNSPLKGLLTNTKGTVSARLGCRREYSFTPKLPGYKFKPKEISKTLIGRTTPLAFSAERDLPADVPPPKPTPPALPCNREQDVLGELKLGMPRESSSINGTLSPQNSACQSPDIYYDAYQMTGALGGDLLEIELKTTGNHPLTLTFNKPDNKPVPGSDNKPVADFKGELPASGDHRVYVVARNTNASLEMRVGYMITVKRVGLSDNGYAEQIRRVVEDLPGQPENMDRFQAVFSAMYSLAKSKSQPPEDKDKLDKTVELLEKLKQLAPTKAAAFEILGVLSLYFNRDLSQSVKLLKQAIDNGGAARFGVFQGKDPDKNRIGSNSPPGWLVISKDKVEFHDLKGTKPGIQIVALNIMKCGVNKKKKHVFYINSGRKDSADFYPWSKQEVEVKEIFGLLKQYVSKACQP